MLGNWDIDWNVKDTGNVMLRNWDTGMLGYLGWGIWGDEARHCSSPGTNDLLVVLLLYLCLFFYLEVVSLRLEVVLGLTEVPVVVVSVAAALVAAEELVVVVVVVSGRGEALAFLLGDEVEEVIVVLAHHGLFVVAGNIVPLDAVVVDVVQHPHARLRSLVDVELGVVWLGNLGVSSLAPGLVPPAWWGLVGGGHLCVGVGEEPTLDVLGLQVLAVAPVEVTQAARRPDV